MYTCSHLRVSGVRVPAAGVRETMCEREQLPLGPQATCRLRISCDGYIKLVGDYAAYTDGIPQGNRLWCLPRDLPRAGSSQRVPTEAPTTTHRTVHPVVFLKGQVRNKSNLTG